MKKTIATSCIGIFLLFSSAFVLAQTAVNGGSAKVIFYRSVDDGGRAYSLTSQNQELAKLKKGDKFEQTLAPGTYYYMADPSTKQVFKLVAMAGETYYVLAGRDDDFFDGQPTLRISTAQQNQAKK